MTEWSKVTFLVKRKERNLQRVSNRRKAMQASNGFFQQKELHQGVVVGCGGC
jgi:hypothetical protein